MSDTPFSPMRTAALDENIVDVVEQPCSIGTLHVTNTGASPIYLHLFNGAAGDQSIDAPAYVIPIGATSSTAENLGRMRFPDGLSMAITATEGVADAPSSTPRVSLGRGAV